MNINNNTNNEKSNKIRINSYILKDSTKNENDYSKNNIESSISYNMTQKMKLTKRLIVITILTL